MSEVKRVYEFNILSDASVVQEQVLLYACYMTDVQERWADGDVRQYRYYGALKDTHHQNFIDLLTLDIDAYASATIPAEDCPTFVYKECEVDITVTDTRYLKSNGHAVFDMVVGLTGPSASKAVFAEFIADARAHYMGIRARNIHRVFVYTNLHGFWEHVNDIPYKSWDNLFLPEKQKAEIMEAIDMFVRGKELCELMQVRYKFNMLLKGPPGSGKTSIVEVIASHLNRRIYKFSPCAADMTDDKFQQLLSTLPQDAILLVEDADALFSNHRERHHGNGITFSTFINGMDGVSTKSNLVSIFTTNHPERLDATLLRSSRMDHEFEIAGLRQACVAAMLKKWLDAAASLSSVTGVAAAAAAAKTKSQEVAEESEKESSSNVSGDGSGGDVQALAKKVLVILRERKLSMASLQSWIRRCVLRGALSADDIERRIDDLSLERSGEDTPEGYI